MLKRILLGILFLSIILLPLYAFAGDESGKGDSKDKAGSQVCDQKSCGQQCAGKDSCCDKCKDGCGKDCKCKCHEGGKCVCAECKGNCSKDCKCKCHEGKKCDGKCKSKDASKEKDRSVVKHEVVVVKKGQQHPGMYPMHVSVRVGDGKHMMMVKPASPLDRETRTFIEKKVKRIAIMPFSDYTFTSQYSSKSFETWASRRICDFLSAEFLKIGKLVVPYDVMAATLSNVKNAGSVESKGEVATLQQQLVSFDLSSEVAAEALRTVYGSGAGSTAENQVASLSLSPDEVKALGKALGVQAIFVGSISDYGTKKHIKADARTFIPPFLGIWNPSKKSMTRMMVYLYNAQTGEMIWESMEEVDREPTFPLFSSEGENYDYINQRIAANIVDHFRDVFIAMPAYKAAPPEGHGPGTTRREKNIHVIKKL